MLNEKIQNDKSTDEQNHRLNNIGPDDRRDTAEHRIRNRDDRDYHDRCYDIDARNELKHKGRRVKHDAGIGDVAEQEHSGHDCSGRQTEATL